LKAVLRRLLTAAASCRLRHWLQLRYDCCSTALFQRPTTSQWRHTSVRWVL